MVEQSNFCVAHRECSHFIKKKIALLIAQQNYGNVWKHKINEGIEKYIQAYPDLPHVKRDERWALDAFNFIGNFAFGPNDCFKVNKDLDTYDINMKDMLLVNKELGKIL